MSKLLYCIRHGIAEHNVNYLKYGSKTFYDPKFSDTSLVKEGVQQARNLRNSWLNLKDIELVIVSPLKRTLQTATEIFKDHSVPIIALDYSREYPLGEHTCNKRSSKELYMKDFPHINFDDLQTNPDELWLSHRKETMDELNTRIDKLKQFILQRPETKIALVNHSGFIGQMKDQEIKYLENGQEELKHCYPYLLKL
jgi:broad specificity phosphatase PhoE